MEQPKIMPMIINEDDRIKESLLKKVAEKITGKDIDMKEIENTLNKVFDEIERYEAYIEQIKSKIVKGDQDYLDRVYHNVTRWKIDYTLIDHYIEEVKGYIAEFKERFSHLKIEKTLKKIKLLDHIANYKEEMEYLRRIYYYIIKDEKTGWKSFYKEFYNKFKQHTKKIRYDYGDEITSTEMVEHHKKKKGSKEAYGEWLVAWKDLFGKVIIPRLQERKYIELLITRVQKALIQIIDYIKRENLKSVNKKLGFFDEEVTRLKSEFMDVQMKITKKYPKLTKSTEGLVKASDRMNKYDEWLAKALTRMTSEEMENYLLKKMGFFPLDYTEKLQRVQNAKLDVIKEEMKASKKFLKDKGRAISLYKEALRTAELLLEKQRKLYKKIYKLAEKRGIGLMTVRQEPQAAFDTTASEEQKRMLREGILRPSEFGGKPVKEGPYVAKKEYERV